MAAARRKRTFFESHKSPFKDSASAPAVARPKVYCVRSGSDIPSPADFMHDSAATTTPPTTPPATSAPAPASAPPPAQLSPAMRQYRQFKAQHPGYVLFFRMGDFYEMFWEDAQLAAKTLGVALTSR